MEAQGVSPADIRDAVVFPAETGPEPDLIPFNARAKKVLELPVREALELGHSYIGAEHLLALLEARDRTRRAAHIAP